MRCGLVHGEVCLEEVAVVHFKKIPKLRAAALEMRISFPVGLYAFFYYAVERRGNVPAYLFAFAVKHFAQYVYGPSLQVAVFVARAVQDIGDRMHVGIWVYVVVQDVPVLFYG